MARSKKTASVTSTAPKTRGIDLQEVEARVTALDKAKRRSYDIFDIEQRVTALDKAKRRSYDIFDIEQRVYNLEINIIGVSS